MTLNVEVFSRQRDNTGEGPLWSVTERCLYWIDIGDKKLHRKSPTDERACSWALPEHPGCLAEVSPGRIAVAMGPGVHLFSLTSGRATLLRPAPRGPTNARFNDGAVDPRGRLWATTMQNNFGPKGEPLPISNWNGALHCFEFDGTTRRAETKLGCPNTVTWSAEGRRFYLADSMRGLIWVYDYDPESGALSNRQVFCDLDKPGIPDGSAMDVDGCLWNARWDGGAILRITPDGNLDRTVDLPVKRPTSCTFGGANLDILFVTSAASGLPDEDLQAQPLSGSVLALQGIGQGLPTTRLADPQLKGAGLK